MNHTFVPGMGPVREKECVFATRDGKDINVDDLLAP